MSDRTRYYVRTSLAVATLAALIGALGHACILVDNPKYCDGSIEPGSEGAPDCDCDRDTNTCLPDAGPDMDGLSCDDGGDCTCSSHVACIDTSGICVDGECLPVDQVVRVSLTSTEPSADRCGDGAADPPQEPCRKIQSGIQRAMELERAWVSVAAADDPYEENLTVLEADVNLIGHPGAVVMPSVDGEPVVDVPATAGERYVRIEGLEMRHDPDRTNTDVGVRCAGGTLHLRSTVVADAGGVGIEITGTCALLMERTRVLDNNAGGVDLGAAANFSLAQNIIARNGNDASEFGGIRIQQVDGIDGTLDFSTIVENEVSNNGDAGGVRCRQNNMITASNNIVTNNGVFPQQVDGTNCTWSKSVLVPDTGVPNENPVGESCAYEAMTYLLTDGSEPCLDGGDRTKVEGLDPRIDLDTDIDGDPRPAGDEGWDVGADEYAGQ